jgi:hypothetical protein
VKFPLLLLRDAHYSKGISQDTSWPVKTALGDSTGFTLEKLVQDRDYVWHCTARGFQRSLQRTPVLRVVIRKLMNVGNSCIFITDQSELSKVSSLTTPNMVFLKEKTDSENIFMSQPKYFPRAVK